jgi:hypothetical protein
MRFTVEMDDAQYRRLGTILSDSGTTLEEALTDFFDDLDDSYTAQERLEAINTHRERLIPWAQVRAQNGL